MGFDHLGNVAGAADRRVVWSRTQTIEFAPDHRNVRCGGGFELECLGTRPELASRTIGRKRNEGRRNKVDARVEIQERKVNSFIQDTI